LRQVRRGMNWREALPVHAALGPAFKKEAGKVTGRIEERRRESYQEAIAEMPVSG